MKSKKEVPYPLHSLRSVVGRRKEKEGRQHLSRWTAQGRKTALEKKKQCSLKTREKGKEKDSLSQLLVFIEKRKKGKNTGK